MSNGELPPVPVSRASRGQCYLPRYHPMGGGDPGDPSDQPPFCLIAWRDAGVDYGEGEE